MSNRFSVNKHTSDFTSNHTKIEDHPHQLERDEFWEALWGICAWAGQTDPMQPQLTNTEVIGFPEDQINAIYQTKDSDRLGPRTQVLVKRVSDRFSPRVNGGIQHDHKEVTGVLRLLAAVYEQRQACLSALDRARLLGVMGMLCRNYTRTGNAQMGLFWEKQGIDYLKLAAKLGTNVPASLQRHLHWLIADTLIGKVNTYGYVQGDRNQREIVQYLVKACKGEPLEATNGLYFSCISRLFTLCDKARTDFATQMLDDLRRAWCVLSAASIKNDDEVVEDGPTDYGTQHPATLSPKEKFVRLPIEQLQPMLPDLLEWHAEDRFAVCTLLSWFARKQCWDYEANVYGYEAAELRTKLDESRLRRPAEPRKVIHHVWQLLRVAEQMKSIARPRIRLDSSVPHSLPPDAVPFVEAGDVTQAAVVLQKVSRKTWFTFQRDMCRLKIAELWGEANNSSRERSVILRVLDDLKLGGHTPQYAAMVRAEAFRLLARNAAYCNAPQDLDKWLALNHEAVGESASPLLACIANGALYMLRMESDIRLAERPIQGQFIWLSILWDTTAWIEGDYQSNLGKFRRPTSDDTGSNGCGPRAFARKVDFLSAQRASPHDLLKLVKEGCTMDHGGLLVPWARGLVNLYGKIRHLDGKNGLLRSNAYRMLTQKAELLDWLVHTGLKPARATDVRERLAMVLSAWFVSLKTSGLSDRNSLDMLSKGEHLVCKSMGTAIHLATTRITRAASCARPRQNAFRRRLRSLIRSLTETDCLGRFQRDLNSLVDQCKTNDAEVAQLYRPLDAEKEDFENPSLITPDYAELDRPKPEHAHEASVESTAMLNYFAHDFDPEIDPAGAKDDIQGGSLLNYFLPGYFENQGIHGEQTAFVVIKTRCANGSVLEDKVFLLPQLHKAIKAYKACLKKTWNRHRIYLNLKSTKEDHLTNFPRLLSDLGGVLDLIERDQFTGNNKAPLNECIDQLQQSLIQLGRALLPPELLIQLKDSKNLVIVPDGQLFMVPIHAIPYNSSGRTLLDDGINVSYRPRSDYGSAWRAAHTKGGLYACINSDDPGFATALGMDNLREALGADNEWAEHCDPDMMLKKISDAGVSIIMAHGHCVRKHELASRIALKEGRCLTTLDIAQSAHNFKKSSVFLFACNSTPQRAAIGRDLLGPAGAFLTKGVGCVSASIWKCRINDAVVIAKHLQRDRPIVKDASLIWSKGLRELSSDINCPLERFVRLGCFVLYSSR